MRGLITLVNDNHEDNNLKDTYPLPLGWGGPSRLHAIYSPDNGGSLI